MELKSKKKAEPFGNELDFVTQAKERLANETIPAEEMKTLYSHMCEEYERLLDEAKFVTKVSDKLEKKLQDSNDKLQQFNEMLAQEAEEEKRQKGKVLEKNKQLYKQTSELDTKTNKLQLILVILLAVLAVIIILLVYKLYFADEQKDLKEKMKQEDKNKKEQVDSTKIKP